MKGKNINHLDKAVLGFYGLDESRCTIVKRDYESITVMVSGKEISLRR